MRKLVIVKIGKKKYYHDPASNRLRNVENPRDTRPYKLQKKYNEMIERLTDTEEEEEEE